MTRIDTVQPSFVAFASASDRLRAIGLMCLAVFCFACLDSCAKVAVTSGLPPLEVAWARYLGNAALLAPFVNPWSVPGLFRSRRPGLQITRSLLLFGSTFFNFLALQSLQLTETVSIMFATPCLVALIAGVLFRQWVGPKQWLAILVGFAGVLVVTRPGAGGGLPFAAVFSVAGTVCYAFYNISTRVLAAHDPTPTTVAFTAIVGVLALTPVMPFVWVMPTPTLALLLAAAGFFGLVGHWFLILAHRILPAQDLAPFMYTQIIWMALSGWIVFSDVPGIFTIVGAGIVIASGLALLWLDRRRTAR